MRIKLMNDEEAKQWSKDSQGPIVVMSGQVTTNSAGRFHTTTNGDTRLTPHEFTATGAELLAYYEEWPMGPDFAHVEGFIYLDEEGAVVGVHPDDELGGLETREALGFFDWQGSGKHPERVVINGVTIPVRSPMDGIDPLQVFRAWRGDRTTVSLVVPHKDLERLKAICDEYGWPSNLSGAATPAGGA